MTLRSVIDLCHSSERSLEKVGFVLKSKLLLEDDSALINAVLASRIDRLRVIDRITDLTCSELRELLTAFHSQESFRLSGGAPEASSPPSE